MYLARKRLDSLATPGFETFDAASSTWGGNAKTAAPIIAPTGYGETSVRYFAEIDRWMFIGEELTPTTNRIIARFADRPEGPWSDPIIVHDMADSAFTGKYCCTTENNCTGKQFFNCNRTGFYGTYLLPGAITHGDGSFTVTYTMSSFDPYNVALYQATFK